MKKSDLLKFIEDEVGQIVKSEKSKKTDLKKETKKDTGLQETDFDDAMFQRLDESRILLKMLLKEGVEFKIYHNSFTSAAQEAISYAEKNGYKVDEDDWFTKVSVRNKKPDPGKTNKHSVALIKNDKESKKMLHFQVYGMDSGSYELNVYIN